MKDIENVIDEVYPTLQKIEQDRLEYIKKRSNTIWSVIVPALVVALIITISFFPFGIISLFVAAIGSGIAYHFMAGKYGASYVDSYKQIVISKLVNTVDPNLHYDSARGIEEDFFIKSELFTSNPDRYRTEDLIYGEYGKTQFHLGEIHAEDKQTSTDKDGNRKTKYVTIFKGLLLVADFHKHFQGRTFVLPDHAERTLGSLGRTLQKLGGRRGTELVQMEDPEFENEFAVHSTDQIESRYILSPALMRRLLDMKERFGKDVRVAFKDSFVWIAVPHRHPYLEPSTKTEATDSSQIHSMLGEISAFIEIIEELDLNTRIWTKE